MIVTLESTDKMVELVVKGNTVPARIWEGVTNSGVRVHAYITRIAHAEGADDTEFARDLKKHAAPSPEIAAIPLRLVL